MVIVDPGAVMAQAGEAMNRLNAIAERYPDAISLAAGRPAIAQARLGALDPAVERFVARRGDDTAAWQYGATAGLLSPLVADLLANDEGITVAPGRILATTGAQEAMFLAVRTLCDPARDVVLVPDPTYVGITGAAAVAQVPIAPIDANGIDAPAIEATIDAVEAAGRRARLLYLVPDFPNPMGATLSTAARERILALARARDLLIVEDSPYRIFDFDAPPPPTFAALDAGQGRVLHVGTLAKALSPGLRLGWLAWPGGPDAEVAALIRMKSFVTVNTSAITQAVAIGRLRAMRTPSLRAATAAGRAAYRAQRDALLGALDAGLANTGARWQRPAGGFFARVDLPFALDQGAVDRCARDYGVIVCPMRMFSPTGRWGHTARLAFSASEPATIAEGARRFARFVRAEAP